MANTRKKKTTKAKGKKAKRKKAKGRKVARPVQKASVKAAAPRAVVKKNQAVMRYLVLDIRDNLKMTAVSALTTRLRNEAKDGKICIVDCDRVLAMTPKGAWSRIEEGYIFKIQDAVVTVAPETGGVTAAVLEQIEPIAADAQHTSPSPEVVTSVATPAPAEPLEAADADADDEDEEIETEDEGAHEPDPVPHSAVPAEAHA